jgi:DNA-directed RNA polymerase specialized sigma24 family protein
MARRPAFVTTHWSVVLAAGRNDTTRAREVLAHLCQTCWFPLYAYVRRRGNSPHDAQDLTQEFLRGCWNGSRWPAPIQPAGGFGRSCSLP